ncbi:unnamed protein product [Notodromas monacha]|uniref:Uncharacterized protein n=1 Tax=Notodromas monacha TaxID=399045 RepID=A0A7R9BER0_9CRUS|nr:unnamed protein product [Notodromas monacha]CAG0912829.1 unnamed protein product [Notodromas monacha]
MDLRSVSSPVDRCMYCLQYKTGRISRCNLPSLNRRKVAIARLKQPANMGSTSHEVRLFILVLCPSKAVSENSGNIRPDMECTVGGIMLVRASSLVTRGSRRGGKNGAPGFISQPCGGFSMPWQETSIFGRPDSLLTVLREAKNIISSRDYPYMGEILMGSNMAHRIDDFQHVAFGF